ncbi:ATPase [Mangrovibacterium sp.]|uniref:ATPase n=1 Tax=Mangrovibacterium sp. TaxID=1961364 RepID=UPI0035644899
MILVADSGSTKTDWLIADDFGETRSFQSAGINPFFRTTEDILAELTPLFDQQHLPVEAIYFYGAGIVNAEKAAVIKKALVAIFGEVKCEIASDVLGAARAACGQNPGIVCILGTGSNACYFDGEQVVSGIPPMGYILGDEGSGAVLGRQLLGDYFKGLMPADLKTKFFRKYAPEKDAVLERVYRTAKPNQYLASFSGFLSDEAEHPYCLDLLRNQFKAFIQRNILQMPESRNLPVNFVGSVAFHFQAILKSELEKEGLKLGSILKEPIEALLGYHR